MAGRKPTPTAAKILRGTFRSDRANPDEPTPDPRLLPPPAHLSAAAKREYWRLGKQLLAQRIVTELDRNVLALYCVAWVRAAEATAKLAEYGEVTVTPQGFPVQSPYLQIYNKCVEQMAKLGASLGLEPSARSRIHAGGKEETADPFEAFLTKGAP